jgi:DNA-binding SARP family transcriptional activator
LRLLGGFAVQVGQRMVTGDGWRLRKARDLVKLLALAPRHRLHREQVVETLWPERPRQRATANNLHQALYVARRTLDPRCLDLRDDLIVLGPAERLWIGPELPGRRGTGPGQSRLRRGPLPAAGHPEAPL